MHTHTECGVCERMFVCTRLSGANNQFNYNFCLKFMSLHTRTHTHTHIRPI